MEIIDDNGLLTTPDGHAMGFIFCFPGHGPYSPDGKVEITPEQADRHNHLLSEAMIAGLDKCEIGQGGMFYYNEKTKRLTTWIGDFVAVAQHVSGRVQRTLWFWRGSRHYKARIRKDADCVWVKRVR